MELPGATYLYNLSILAITFAALSVLLTVVRQIIGGKLSGVDIHLVTTFVSAGFGQAIAAVLPPAVDLFGLAGPTLWAVASGTAAILSAAVIGRIQWERSKFATEGPEPLVVVSFVGLWLSVLMLGANALIPAIQGVGLHAAAVTLSLGAVMWAFVRRIASLGGDNAGGDWDLKHG